MGLYADSHKRGYYPVWQSLDHKGFFPGSHLYFVTISVCPFEAISDSVCALNLHVICCIQGDESERLETMTDAEVQAEVMGVLRKMYPDVDVPEPTQLKFGKWFSDPLTRGSWSNWPPR